MNSSNYKLSPKTKKNNSKLGSIKSTIWVFGLKYWKIIVILVINALQFICLIAQSFVQKLEILNLEPKMSYLDVLGSYFEKPLSCLESAPSNLPYCKVWFKNKNFKFGTKNARFPYMGLELEIIIVIFEISLLKFVLSLSMMQK